MPFVDLAALRLVKSTLGTYREHFVGLESAGVVKFDEMHPPVLPLSAAVDLYADSSPTAAENTDVCRSTSASLVSGHIRAMLWNGVISTPRLARYTCR